MVKQRELATGVVLFCTSGMVLLSMRGLPLTHKGTGFGPGAFPFIVAIGLLLLSLVQILRAFSSKAEKARESQKAPGQQGKPMTVLLVTIGYTLLMSRFGFFISSILFLFAATRVFGERRYFVSAVYAGVFACLAYLFFKAWLKVALPSGSLW